VFGDSSSPVQVRTLAVRITDELRAQSSKNDPNVLKRAQTVRAEIERAVQTKRNAIAAIFGAQEEVAAPSTSGGSRGKQASTDA
jgi:hypothetical protein